jgi:hypothetical protein
MNRFFWFFILIMSLLPVFATAQRSPDDEIALHTVIQEITTGVFVRRIVQSDPYTLDEVKREEAIKKKGDVTPKQGTILAARQGNSFHVVRFDKPLIMRSVSVGRVFIGELYREATFIRKYEANRDYAMDTDGFYLMYKLYTGANGRYLLNIYPTYVTNLCKKQMHQNNKVCSDSAAHYQQLTEIVRSLQEDHIEDSLLLQTEFKCFEIDFLHPNGQNVIDDIDLLYSKYKLSHDRVVLSYYSFTHFSEKFRSDTTNKCNYNGAWIANFLNVSNNFLPSAK